MNQNVKNHYNHRWKSLYYIMKTNNKHNKWTKLKVGKKGVRRKKICIFFHCWMLLRAYVNYGLSTPKASNLRVPRLSGIVCAFAIAARIKSEQFFQSFSLTHTLTLLASIRAFHWNSLFLKNSFPLHSITNKRKITKCVYQKKNLP